MGPLSSSQSMVDFNSVILYSHGRRSGLQTDDVGLGESELGRILDGDEAVLGTKDDSTASSVVCPSSSHGDNDVQAATDTGGEELEHPEPERPVREQFRGSDRDGRELAHV